MLEPLKHREASGQRSLKYLYNDELTITVCFTKIDVLQETILQCSQKRYQEFVAQTVKVLSKEQIALM